MPPPSEIELGRSAADLLEGFPHRFHEPYYRSYAIDDLEAMFSAAGLAPQSTSTPYLAKLMARVKR